MAPKANNNGVWKWIAGIAVATVMTLTGVIWGYASGDTKANTASIATNKKAAEEAVAASELKIEIKTDANAVKIEANATDIDTLHGNIIGLSKDVSYLINMVQELKKAAKERDKLLMEMNRKLGP